jgi:nucleoside-diphosphate-sugar epimerase
MSVAPSTSPQNLNIEQLPTPGGDVQDSRFNQERLRHAMGWNPEVKREVGIRRSAAGFHTQ